VEHAHINREIARWARERTGLSVEELAGQVGVTSQQITQWESGQQKPPFGRAQDLAKTLRIPFGYLFLSRPPGEEPPIPDLRSLNDRRKPPSPDFLDLLNDVLVKHDWYVEHAKETGAEQLAFVGNYAVSAGVLRVAEDLRTVIQPDSLRAKASSWSDYLRLLVQSAENAGMVVMRAGIVRGNPHRRLSVAEFRGFVVNDHIAPLVFINSRDAQAAQIFTLAHELAHIWVGQSGISNPEPAPAKEPTTHLERLEQFCNEVAVEFLVPADQFDQSWPTTKGDAANKAEKLARKYKVSVPVILRRARERSHISKKLFFELLQAHQEKIDALDRMKESEDKSSGGNFYNTFFARNSNKLAHAVLVSSRGGSLSALDAARLLNVRATTIPKLVERIPT
jgi:Zn-dependent peptidase ImmA (M78 family)/transcriptional regulator with XRE-family HTH domain